MPIAHSPVVRPLIFQIRLLPVETHSICGSNFLDVLLWLETLKIRVHIVSQLGIISMEYLSISLAPLASVLLELYWVRSGENYKWDCTQILEVAQVHKQTINKS